MEAVSFWPWLGLLLLGALHGINPGMGWLFAVSLGLQEDDARAVWGALGPLALGHLLAIAAVLVLAGGLGLVIPSEALRWGVALALCGMGALQLVRHLHPRVGGMRVSARDLTLWSFLMASAHGAGLMALPLALAARVTPTPGLEVAGSHHAHRDLLSAGLSAPELTGLLATIVHSAGYLAVTGLIAVLVYEKLGLRLLRTAWINVDLMWSVALIVTGVLTALV